MSRILDRAVARRGFLGGLTLSFGSVAVVGVARAKLLSEVLPPPPAAGLACSALDPCGDWQLDDICNSYPPYAFRVDPVGASPLRRDVVPASADWHWIA